MLCERIPSNTSRYCFYCCHTMLCSSGSHFVDPLISIFCISLIKFLRNMRRPFTIFAHTHCTSRHHHKLLIHVLRQSPINDLQPIAKLLSQHRICDNLYIETHAKHRVNDEPPCCSNYLYHHILTAHIHTAYTNTNTRIDAPEIR